MRITNAYVKQNRLLHRRGVYGSSGAKWAGLITEFYGTHDCASLLDYGCGRQTLAQTLPPNVNVRGFDPCVTGFDDEPEPADMVFCGDVMEHVEPECVAAVLRHIQLLAHKVAFFVISTRPAKKKLSDGRNAHLSLKSEMEWVGYLVGLWDVYHFKDKGAFNEVVCLCKPRIANK